MRRALVLVVLLVACAKREEARPAPETKPSAPPEPLNTVEAMACRDGVFGKQAPPTETAPAASTTTPAATATATATASASVSALPSMGMIGTIGSDAGGLFAPLDAAGFGVGGLGMSGIGGFGHGSGAGFGRLLGTVYSIAGAPTEPGGKTTLAIAKGVCSVNAAIKQCRSDAGNPVGTLTFDLALVAGKLVSATKSGGDLSGESLEGCLSTALVAQTYDPAPDGKIAYRFTFDPPKREIAPGVLGAPAGVTGSLAPEVISRIVRAHAKRARACYETALKSDPKLTGRLTMRFTIDAKGKTKDVRVADGTIADASMRSCVIGVFATMTFPEPGGGEAMVSYPLTFSAP